MAVARGIGAFRHDRQGDTFRGWLRTITFNRVRDFVTRKPPGVDGFGGSGGHEFVSQILGREPENLDSVEEDERLLLLRRAADLVLADCKEATRKAFLRVVIGGEEPGDVARDLGMSVNSVYLARSRLLRRMREEFAEVVELLEPAIERSSAGSPVRQRP